MTCLQECDRKLELRILELDMHNMYLVNPPFPNIELPHIETISELKELAELTQLKCQR